MMEHVLFGLGRPLAGALAVAVAVSPFDPNDTWRVDPANPSARTFANIADAMIAARSGDTIVVAPGVHSMPGVITKGVRIVGEPGAVLDPTMLSIRVVALPSDERFVLANFELTATAEPRIQLDGNQGSVHLIGIHGDSESPQPARSAGLWIRDCRLVTIDDCSWFGRPAIDALRSRLRISGGSFKGTFALQGRVAGHGLRCTDCDVELSDVRLTGADQFLLAGRPEVAIHVRGGTTLFAGADSVGLGGSDPFGGLAPVIDANPTAQLTIGGNVRLNPGGGIGGHVVGTVPTFIGEFPTTRAHVQADQIVTRVTGRPWDGALVFGGPIAEPTPTSFGEIWLNAGASIPVGLIGLDGNGRGELRYALTSTYAIEAGAALTLQVVVIGPLGIRVGLPAIAAYPGR